MARHSLIADGLWSNRSWQGASYGARCSHLARLSDALVLRQAQIRARSRQQPPLATLRDWTINGYLSPRRFSQLRQQLTSQEGTHARNA